MGAMYKLKAYFGMVPAEELGEFEEERFARRSGGEHGWDDRWDGRTDRWDDREGDPERLERTGRAERERADRDRVGADRFDVGGPDSERADRYTDRFEPDRSDPDRRIGRPVVSERTLPPPVRTLTGPVSVRGSLAMDTGMAQPEPVQPLAPTAVPEQRERFATSAALSRITTLQPASYNEARTIGERYRDGVPVIMNLTDLDDAAAKRLVDFAAGLAFALRGSIDKVTSRVFLLTPADVEVSADDARKLVGRVGTERGRLTGH